MFSRRTPAPHGLNRLARALAARTRPFLDLTVTNPTSVALRSGEADLFDGATSGRDARVLAALADPRGLVYTPDPKGILSARTAVANYYAAVHGVLVPPGQIVLTASSSEAYGWLFKLAGDPGDVVLVPAPSYPLLDALAELECLTLAALRARERGRLRVSRGGRRGARCSAPKPPATGSRPWCS